MERLKQAILDIIFDQYKKCYIGPLVITKMKPCGYDVALGLDNAERPIHIAAQLDMKDFLKFFREEMRWRHLGDSHFYTGYKFDVADDEVYRAQPINHACHAKLIENDERIGETSKGHGRCNCRTRVP